jgi:hypothetical protein
MRCVAPFRSPLPRWRGHNRLRPRRLQPRLRSKSPGSQNSTRNAQSDPIAQAMNGIGRQSVVILAFDRPTYRSIRMMAPIGGKTGCVARSPEPARVRIRVQECLRFSLHRAAQRHLHSSRYSRQPPILGESSIEQLVGKSVRDAGNICVPKPSSHQSAVLRDFVWNSLDRAFLYADSRPR